METNEVKRPIIKISLDKTPYDIFYKTLRKLSTIQEIEKDLDKLEEINPGLINALLQKKRYLYQSYIVHLMAGWQDFNVNLVNYCFSKLKQNSSDEFINSIAQKRIDSLTGKFNTPSAENINNLFKEAFGVAKVSSSWVVEKDKYDNKKALNVLDSVLKTRHKIAHTGTTKTPLSYDDNFENMRVIFEMAYATEKYLFVSLGIVNYGPPNIS